MMKLKGKKLSKSNNKQFLVFLGLLSFFLIALELYLFRLSHSLPFIHSIFFFGLVNFNVLLFLLLLFFIFKNIVKNLSKKETKNRSYSLKNKLIAAFSCFSFIPTVLMFLIFIFYINTSFDKWFSTEVKEVLKSSLEVNKNYVIESKNKNYHFASLISQSLQNTSSLEDLQNQLNFLRQKYNLDAVEYYSSKGERFLSSPEDGLITNIPEIPLKFREKALLQGGEDSMVQPFQKGNLIRIILAINEPNFEKNPRKKEAKKGLLLVSSFVPFSLLSKIDHITSAYESLRKTNLLEVPLKSIYLILFILMTFVILLSAAWFGLFLAKQLIVPLELLGKATHKLTQGEYKKISSPPGSKEIHQLIEDFNSMTYQLQKSQGETKRTYLHLKQILKKLNEHNRYMKVILSHISAGVISTNSKNEIITINPYAIQLLNLSEKKEDIFHQEIKAFFSRTTYKSITKFLESFEIQELEKAEKELNIQMKDQATPIHITLSALKDSQGQNLGKVLVLHDLSLLVSAQREAAWKEVAKKIAHEIKNPLTPIKLAAQRLKNKFEKKVDDHSFEHCISMIIDQVDSIKSLVNEFSYFSRLPKLQPDYASINQIIGDVFILFREAHKSIEWHWNPDPSLCDFLFDSSQIKRVITNLLDNAINALKKVPFGKIELFTQHRIPFKTVRIIIKDNGEGIPDILKNRLFEPYVTTKWHGTGLGLAIAKKSIEDHNGSITFSSPKKGTGTQMVIDLPMVIPKPVISIKEKQMRNIQ